MNLDTLRIFVVSQKRLKVFPAVETTHFTEWSIDDGFERLCLRIAPNRPLNMGRLDFATMMKNFASCVDEGLSDVKRGSITFAIPKNHHDTSFLDRSSNSVHFWRYLGHGVGHVCVDQICIFDDAFRPDGPAARIRNTSGHNGGMKQPTTDIQGSRLQEIRER